jgi:hypothetical protein
VWPKNVSGGDLTTERLIIHEAELAKIEEQRIQSLETQAIAVLTVVLAIAAFAASVLDRDTLRSHFLSVGGVAGVMLVAAGFAVAALGPRALKARFWMLQSEYAARERHLAVADATLAGDLRDVSAAQAILESWRARRALSSYLAERKALWLTCSLIALLLTFVLAGVAAMMIVD